MSSNLRRVSYVILAIGAVGAVAIRPPTFGGHPPILFVIAAVILFGGIFRAADIRFATREKMRPGDVTTGYAVPTPGEVYAEYDAESIQTELREFAIEAVETTANCRRSEAEERVERGTWTDDDLVAAYLADGEVSVSFRQRVQCRLTGTDPRETIRQRTLAAIEARRSGERDV